MLPRIVSLGTKIAISSVSKTGSRSGNNFLQEKRAHFKTTHLLPTTSFKLNPDSKQASSENSTKPRESIASERPHKNYSEILNGYKPTSLSLPRYPNYASSKIPALTPIAPAENGLVSIPLSSISPTTSSPSSHESDAVSASSTELQPLSVFDALPTLDVAKTFNPDNLLFSNAFQKTVDKYNCVVSVRLPSTLGQIHLKENFPTKNFHIKAKSSPSGPTAGLISADPSLSKRPKSKWKDQSRDINEALKAGAKKLPLRLSQSQIQALQTQGAMSLREDGLFYATYDNTEKEYAFSIDPEGFVRYASGDKNGQPVEVLSNPPEKVIPNKKGAIKGLQKELMKEILDKPVTADYDLFSIIPNKNHAHNHRPLQVGQNTLQLIRGSVENIPKNAIWGSPNLQELYNTFNNQNVGSGWNAFKEAKGDKSELDPNKGNFHTYGHALVKDINRNVADAGYKGGKLVWHGDEMGNPASQGFNPVDAPVFFIPGYQPVQVETKQDLIALHNKLRTLNYEPETSLSFGV